MGTPVGGTLPDEAGFVTVDGLYRITLKRQPNGTIIPLMSAVNKRWLSLGTTYTVSRGWAGEALERLTPEEAYARVLQRLEALENEKAQQAGRCLRSS